jgi:cupin fold WbuC family metalloprotein
MVEAKASPRLRQNLDMRTSPKDGSQRMLNALEPRTEVPIHRHEETSETVICLEGCLDEVFFEDTPEGYKEVERYRICPREGAYGIQVPKNTWHSIEVYEPSVIFEAKDGAYGQ